MSNRRPRFGRTKKNPLLRRWACEALPVWWKPLPAVRLYRSSSSSSFFTSLQVYSQISLLCVVFIFSFLGSNSSMSFLLLHPAVFTAVKNLVKVNIDTILFFSDVADHKNEDVFNCIFPKIRGRGDHCFNLDFQTQQSNKVSLKRHRKCQAGKKKNFTVAVPVPSWGTRVCVCVHSVQTT